MEIPPAVQWLEFHTFMTEGLGSISGQGTKIPQASQCSKTEKKKKGIEKANDNNRHHVVV